MERLAVLLGACATLTTLVGWGVALAPPAGRGPPPAPWQVVERPGGRFTVPPAVAGWRVAGAQEVVYYTDPRGEPVVGVTGPAVLDEGYCREAAAPSNRAFAGLTAPARGRADEVNARLARAWAAAVAGQRRGPRAVRPEPVVLADGSPAVRRHLVVRVSPGACRPARAAVDLVSARAGAVVVTLVLVRDLQPGGVSEAEAAKILASVRLR